MCFASVSLAGAMCLVLLLQDDVLCVTSCRCCSRGLGGKLGLQVQHLLNVEFMGQVRDLPLRTLQQQLGSRGCVHLSFCHVIGTVRHNFVVV